MYVYIYIYIYIYIYTLFCADGSSNDQRPMDYCPHSEHLPNASGQCGRRKMSVVNLHVAYTQFAYQEFGYQDLFQGLGCPGTLVLIGTNT